MSRRGRGGWLALSGCCCAFEARAALPLKEAADAQLWSLGLRSLLVGALLCALAGAVLWWLRRLRALPAPQGDGPRLARSRRISQKTVLLEVEWEGRRYLLAESQNGAQLLDSRADAPRSDAA